VLAVPVVVLLMPAEPAPAESALISPVSLVLLLPPVVVPLPLVEDSLVPPLPLPLPQAVSIEVLSAKAATAN